MNEIELARRVRPHSWKDVILILVAAVIFLGVEALLKKLFPTIEDRHVRIIGYTVSIGTALILWVSIGWFQI